MHPTIEKFKLHTYTSRYNGVTCGICRGEIKKGDKIACISPILTELRTLNMSAKVFKYAHQSCVPLWVDDNDLHEAVKEATGTLWGITDPNWSLDYVGFDKPGAGLAQSWMASDYSRLGTQRMAKHLLRFEGQLGDDALYAKIKKVANMKASSSEAATKAPTKRSNGWLLRERPGSRSEVFIGVQAGNLVVYINKWENPSHENVYLAVKKLRARWDGRRKCWVLPENCGLTVDNFEDKLDINTDKTDVACSTRAWEMLSASAGEQEAPEEAEEVRTYEIAGLTCEVTDSKPDGKIHITANGQGLKIHLDPPWVNATHAQVKDEIKNYGAKWDKDSKTWRLGASALVANFSVFADQDVSLTEDALAMIDSVLGRQQLSNALDASSDEIKEKVTEALPKDLSLYPFQYAGVEFVERAGGRAIIADDMGTGKSVQTAGYLALHPEQRPAVLVVPAVVTGNWCNEIAKWLPNERTQHLKTGSTKLDPEATIYVVTYDLVKKHLDSFKTRKPLLIVGDEVHLCKNPKTARTKAFIELAQLDSVKSMIGLSGTPIVNRPLEFHTFLSLLNPVEFGNWFKYTERYCGGHYEQIYVKGGRGATKRVWQTGGATNLDELNQRLRSLMIRRRKEDVLTELPLKVYQDVEVEMKPKDRKAYKAVIKKDDIALAQITAARQAAGRIKVRHALDWVETHPDTPLLIFAHHQDVLNGLESGLSEQGIRVGRIDGSVSQERRTELVKAFQDGELDVMVLSIRAAGVGITLTRASDVLFVEQDWTPGANRQAEDRAHRIGQEDSVTIHNLVLKGSVDEDMHELLTEKQEVLDAVLDGKESGDTDLDIRKELVARWENKKRK